MADKIRFIRLDEEGSVSEAKMDYAIKQMQSAKERMQEYTKRLEAAGFTNVMDEWTAPEGSEPNLARNIWNALIEERNK